MYFVFICKKRPHPAPLTMNELLLSLQRSAGSLTRGRIWLYLLIPSLLASALMSALVIFALAGLAVMQSTLQQTRQLGRMEEKILASWLADNQLVQLRLEKRWPALSWSETTVEAAGTRWFVRWQGVETALPQLRALDVEVRRQKSDPAPLATLRTWVTPP